MYYDFIYGLVKIQGSQNEDFAIGFPLNQDNSKYPQTPTPSMVHIKLVDLWGRKGKPRSSGCCRR